jgi:lipoate-protein ligase B
VKTASTVQVPADAPPPAAFRTLRPGRLGYREGLALQEELLEFRRGSGPDLLLLLEHEPVVTLGRGAHAEHLLLSPEELTARGIALAQAARGGDVTWHGPGQLVGYPIVDLAPLGRNLHGYLRRLEEVLLRTLDAFGCPGQRRPGSTGAWIGERKIASIGVGVRHWITWHGFALNVNTDPQDFSCIVPCGLAGVQMTSLAESLGRTIPLSAVEEVLIQAFAEVFSRRHEGAHVR